MASGGSRKVLPENRTSTAPHRQRFHFIPPRGKNGDDDNDVDDFDTPRNTWCTSLVS